MRVPQSWFVEPIEIKTYLGQGAYGDAHADPVTVLGHVSGGRRVNSSPTGDEVVTNQRVMLPNPARLADGTGTVDPAAVLTAESLIVAATISGTVASVEPHIQPGTGAVVYVSGEVS